MPLRAWRHGIRRILDDAKRQRKKGNPAKYVALPPVRSKKGNQNRGNSQNSLPFSACKAGKGNEKRETQQNPLPLPPARSEKATTPKRPQTTRQPHLGAAALFYILSAITADHIFSKSSEFFRMDPTSLRWMNRGSKC